MKAKSVGSETPIRLEPVQAAGVEFYTSAKFEQAWAASKERMKAERPDGLAPETMSRTLRTEFFDVELGCLRSIGEARRRENLVELRRALDEYERSMREIYEKFSAEQERLRCRHGRLPPCPDCDIDGYNREVWRWQG